MKQTIFPMNIQLFAESGVNFEDILRKHVGEDGSIPADNISKAAQAISSAVGRAFVDKARYNAKLDEISQLEQDKNAAEDTATKASKWEEKYTKEHEAFEKYKADTEAKATRNAVKEAYKKLLTEENIDPKRHDAILRATNFDDTKLDKDGKLEGEAELRKSINDDWSDFKVTTHTEGAKVATPPANNGPAKRTREEILAIKNTVERQRAMAENHELFGI
jgi:vacuolar-type H+-ATPase subunit I/STV1